jgi:hypothetical protein
VSIMTHFFPLSVLKLLLQAAAGGVKKPHRFRPGTVALREIRRYRARVRFNILYIIHIVY